MKKILALWIFIFLFPVYVYSEEIGFLRSSLIEGDVQVKTEYITEWLPLSLNVPIREKDRIWVPDGGRAELNTRDGTYIRLNENSSIEVIRVERDFLRFYIPSGHLYVNYKGSREALIQIDLEDSTVIADEKAIFRIDATNSTIKISVYKGEIKVEDKNERIFVTEGKTLTLRDSYRPELSSLGPVDEWERWNRDRDRMVSEKRYSQKYLPQELREYSYDFDNYGEWVYVSDYGYVWTPRLSIHIDWAPYRNGRWVWIGGDFVWISYDPWGWVPHHYGRWVFIARIGWCWVPPKRGHVYWAPGYVAWVYTPTYVAWVPLAPYEIYYGYGYYGPYSVNIIDVDIRKIQIKKVYKNIHVKNAVTVVHRDTFLKGRHEKIKIEENPFLKHGPTIGRPAFKPERETFMPIIKDVPKSKLPPQRLEERFKETKRERPSYREKEIERFKEKRYEKEIKEPPFKEEKRIEKGLERDKRLRPNIENKEERRIEKGLEKDKKRRPDIEKRDMPSQSFKEEKIDRPLLEDTKNNLRRPGPKKAEQDKDRDEKTKKKGKVRGNENILGEP